MVAKQTGSQEFWVREAVEADLPALVGFLAELALHVAGGPPQSLKKKERRRFTETLASSIEGDDSLIVVAEAPDGELVGMGYVAVLRSQSVWEQAGDVEFRSGLIDDIWVEPEWRKAGVFTAILGELVAFAEARDVQELILEYSVSNEEAAAVWNKLGFVPTGVRAAAFTATVREALGKRQRDDPEESE